MTQWEAVIGLEIHVELKTESKLFCSCPTAFGAPPNSQCCPVCMGYPGALPVLNQKAVLLAVRAGLALGCQIQTSSGQDRKQYAYPDLPKAYQISQYDRPLCLGGRVAYTLDGVSRELGITRIHMEEDAGKLIHEGALTKIDYNRCGVPLIEIVTEPGLHSGAEARAFLRKLHTLLRYADVSDCRMNEGSFRVDVNLSVRPEGAHTLGERTEIKNINSFAFVQKAIESETERQIALMQAGKSVSRETRRFDPATGKTNAMRTKEDAADYRFFPDPDLPPVAVSQDVIEGIRAQLPELPDRKRERWMRTHALPEADACVLCADRALADYYDRAASGAKEPRRVANLVLSELLRLCRSEEFSCPIDPYHVQRIADMLSDGIVNSATAKRLVGMLWQRDTDPCVLVRENGWEQINDKDTLYALLHEAVAVSPRSLEAMRLGKRGAEGALVGYVMKKTDGRANAELLAELIGKLV